VTLGARSFVKDDSGHIVKGGKRHPDEENNVTIYPNSTILGGETIIGANSTIGANVFLMQSVPRIRSWSMRKNNWSSATSSPRRRPTISIGRFDRSNARNRRIVS
jgi:hypothetical protein